MFVGDGADGAGAFVVAAVIVLGPVERGLRLRSRLVRRVAPVSLAHHDDPATDEVYKTASSGLFTIDMTYER